VRVCPCRGGFEMCNYVHVYRCMCMCMYVCVSVFVTNGAYAASKGDGALRKHTHTRAHEFISMYMFVRVCVYVPDCACAEYEDDSAQRP